MRLTFYVDKPDSQASALMLNIAFRGQRLRFGTGISIVPILWNHDKQQLRASDPLQNANQKRLDAITAYVTQQYNELNFGSRSKVISPDDIESFRTRILDYLSPDFESKQKKGFSDFYQDFIDTYTLRTRSGLITAKRPSASTISHHQSVLTGLELYATSKKRPLSFASIDETFYREFCEYLANERGLFDNSISNYIKSLKTFMKWSQEKNLHQNHQYLRFHRNKKDGDRIALIESELRAVRDMDFSDNLRIDLTRDRHLLQTFTALRYDDLVKLRPHHFDDAAGVIRFSTQKTERDVIIPMIPPLRTLLAKYPSRTFEWVSNVKQNLYLKELGILSGLNTMVTVRRSRLGQRVEIEQPKHELLTTHVARRTFVTLSSTYGIQDAAIGAVIGHAPATIQDIHYKKFDESTLVSMFCTAWDKF